MKEGDLVRAKQRYCAWPLREIYGLITEIEKEFYRNAITSPKDDRLTILWDNGVISSKSEKYVEKVEK